ncbi:MAG: hypothetical protein ACXWLM_07650 [Myxococcales bacterium]
MLLALLLALSHATPVESAEVVIVTGSADHMEHVMQRAGVKFALITPDQLPATELRWQQILMVNCTGQMSPAAQERVKRFVNAGGMLYTTDHAVHYLLEAIFPGKVRYNQKSTSQEIFPMQTQGDRGFVAKISDHGEPRWQVAGGGMLFDVLDPSVEVLMRSKEVAARYQTNGVLGVRFRVGDGQVVHVTGHFFTQPGQTREVAAAGRAFEQLSENVVREKKADQPRVERLYSAEAIAPRQLLAEPKDSAASVKAPSGAPVSTAGAMKVHVLRREGGYVEIRDEQGNQGWVAADSVK